MKKICEAYDISAVTDGLNYLCAPLFAISISHDTDIIVGTGEFNGKEVAVIFKQPSMAGLTYNQIEAIQSEYFKSHGSYLRKVEEIDIYIFSSYSKLLFTSHPEFLPDGFDYEGVYRDYELTLRMVVKAKSEEDAIKQVLKTTKELEPAWRVTQIS